MLKRVEMTIPMQAGTPPQTSALAPSEAQGVPKSPAVHAKGKFSRLFIKYVALFVAVVGVALLSNGIFEVIFYYREHKAALIRVQHEQAVAAAAKISQFIKEIENQLGWTTQLPWSPGSIEQRRFDALRLLRQVPAITELAQVDSSGKERLRVSRLAMDVIDSGLDLSKEAKFAEAIAQKVYYGPVYFRRESEPYMTLAIAGTRKDAGVSIAEVNLKLIWDVVSQIRVGEHGEAYVVGSQGRLIAHPDISLVLRNTDMSKLSQVRLAQAHGGTFDDADGAKNIQGKEVLTASAPISPLPWTMFVELPVDEAYASLNQALQRLAVVLLAASIVAVLAGIFLARRMVGPIQALRVGAARIGGGDFAQRIAIHTGDELEGLADQFNDMGARLQESYADLEKKVESRTAELRESLQQQTATAEVLGVISGSPGDLAPVFDAMLEKAMQLCGADFGVLNTFDGDRFHTAATRGLPPAYEASRRNRPLDYGPTTAPARLLQGEPFVEETDLLESEAYRRGEPNRRALVDLGGARSVLAVPLRKDERVVGTVMIFRQENRSFSEKQIKLLQQFAAQAVIAIENVRLLNETKEALRHQTGSANILRVIASSPTDVSPVLQAIVQSACELCEAYDAVLMLKEGDELRLGAHFGPISLSQQRWPNDRTSISGRAIADRRPVHVTDVLSDEGAEFAVAREMSRVDHCHALLGAPLLRDGEGIGAIVLRRAEPHPFSTKQIALLQTFADQAVIAIANVKLFEEVQARTRDLAQSLEDLRTAQDRLIQTEKLASLGQLTAGIAHEIKNPLNFVNNFSALSVELIDELDAGLKSVALDGKRREEIDEITHMLKGNLERVIQHGKRADSIIRNMLVHSREGSGERRPTDINAIVDESLNLAYHGARAERSGFNITLKRDLDPNAGTADLYPQEITRVLLNLISNGFYAATKRKEAAEEGFEPTLSASTRSIGNAVEIRIRDNGTGIPPGVKEKIFNPFFTTKPAGEGTGLGLSMSHDIVVKQHGGKIDLDTEPGAFTEFIIVLPRSSAARQVAGGGN